MTATDSSTATRPDGETERYEMLIGGGWKASSDGATFNSINPFDAQPWAQVPAATTADIDEAVGGAARRAFDKGPWLNPHPSSARPSCVSLAISSATTPTNSPASRSSRTAN